MVTASLEGALRAFRLSQEPREDYMLWCDGLCINQQDLEERAWEVKRMRDIYGDAHSVFLWLGDEADEGDLAMPWVETICAELQVRRETSGQWLYVMHILEEQDVVVQIHVALYRLFLRPYWRRAWLHVPKFAPGSMRY